MSYFFGVLQGSSKAPADRRGSRHSGITATLGTRRAKVRLTLAHQDGADHWILDAIDKQGVPVFEIAAGQLIPVTAAQPFNQYDAEGRN